jgi:hypothetical protein
MKIGDLEIPNSLLDYHLKGKLVVFAGAGISIPSPSNLPCFLELAKSIAAGSSFKLTPDDEAELDRFLGKLENEGVKVRELTKRALTVTSSEPTKWHEFILKLFVESDVPIRIVTTNFDAHFCTEIQRQGINCQQYYAPALPLGDNFTGMVYIHGHVSRDLSTLVITDDDFGRAYLTRGWATRFLKDMFSAYAVLFVGYSYNDPLMHYLARGLNFRSSAPRFILTEDAQNERWKHFEITPIGYPESQHEVALEGFAKWLEFQKRGAIGHERDISRICSALPPILQEDIDYLEHVLQSDSLRPVFIEKAKSIEWVNWVEERGLLGELFEPQETPNARIISLGQWYIERLFELDENHLFDRVICRRQSPSPLFWNILCVRLWQIERSSLGDSIFASLVNFLIDRSHYTSNILPLDYILGKCDPGKDLIVAERLFIWLTEPRFAGRSGRYRNLNNVESFECVSTFRGNPYWLRKSWAGLFVPNIGLLSNLFFIGLCRNLLEIYRIEEGQFVVDPQDLDSIAHKRPAVHESSQNLRPVEHLDILVVALRDILDWQAKECPEKYRVNIQWLSQNETSIFQRIVMHSLSGDEVFAPEEKVEMVLANGWIFNWNNHHEAFQIASAIFAYNSILAKNRLTEAVRLWPGIESSDASTRERSLNSALGLIDWLNRKFPNEPTLSAAQVALAKELPSFKPFAHPEYTSWVDISGYSPTRPFEYTAEALLSMELEKLTKIIQSRDTPDTPFEKDAIWSVINDAGSKNADWYIQLAGNISPNSENMREVFIDFLNWAQTAVGSNEERHRILTIVKRDFLAEALSLEITEVLLQWLRSGSGMSTVLAEEIIDVALSIWNGPAKLQIIDFSDDNDFISQSINHIGGKLGEVLIHGLSKLAGGKPLANGMPVHFRIAFEEMTNFSNQRDKMGIVALARQLNFLSVVDRPWVVSKLLPKFSWAGEPDAATHCWQGFLINWRLNKDLIVPLWSDIHHTFERRRELGRYRDQLCYFVSGMVFFADVDHFELLSNFTSHADRADFSAFYHQCQVELEALTEEKREEQKKRWIGWYFEIRSDGKLRRFEEFEFNGLIKLARFYPELLDLIAAEVKQLPMASEFNFGFLVELLKDNCTAIRKNSNAVADLILSRLKLQHGYCSAYKILEVSEIVIESWTQKDTSKLEKICQEMRRLHLPEASAFQSKLAIL